VREDCAIYIVNTILDGGKKALLGYAVYFGVVDRAWGLRIGGAIENH
jgi:hypothetical protein